MADGNSSTNGSRIEAVADSVWAKITARFIVPGVVALIAGLGTLILQEFKDTLKTVSTDVKGMARDQAENTTAVKVLSGEVRANRERSDTAIDILNRDVRSLDGRVDRLERRP